MSHPGLRTLYFAPDEHDRLSALSRTRNRSRDEVLNFLLKRQFNAVSGEKSYPANVVTLPQGKEPPILSIFILQDFELDRTLRAFAFDNKIGLTELRRALIIGGLDWYDSVIAAGQPVPHIPIDHERRQRLKDGPKI
ncbi:MAG: hypothetical protein JWO78_1401 [Micavibrio sp.]|nr:hypothetical protein [Micavibrio sp.]